MKHILLVLIILLKIIVFSQNKFSINELKTLSTSINLTSSTEYTEFDFLKTKIDTSLSIFLGESMKTTPSSCFDGMIFFKYVKASTYIY